MEVSMQRLTRLSPHDIAILTLLVLLPCRASGQVVRTFGEIQGRLQAGEQVLVTDSAGRAVRGTIADVSVSSLQVLVNDERRTFNEANVQRVDRFVRDSLKNGMLWGVAVGAVAGVLGMAAAANSGGKLEDAGPLAAVALIAFPLAGAAVGAAVDASRKTREPVYVRGNLTGNRVSASFEVNARNVGIIIHARF
jgi:hypothetical protein